MTIDLLKEDTSNLQEFSNLFDNPRIIALKAEDSSFFVASIQKVIVYRNQIFILDDRFSNLSKFDSIGHFINNYGKIGLSKNEYKKISDFDIDTVNNRIVIFSNADKSLYYYSLETGAFIKKLNIELFGSQICTLPGNEIMLYRNFSTEAYSKEKDYNILIIDSSGKTVSKAFPFNSKLSFMEWKATGFLKKSNDKLFFANAFSDTVYKFDKNQFLPTMDANILSDNVSAIKDDHNKLFASQTLLDSNSTYMESSFLMNDRFIVIDFIRGKRIRTAFRDIKTNRMLTMSAKLKTDPLIALALTPMFLTNDNTIYFKFTSKNLLYVKAKYPELLNKLSKENKEILNNPVEKSGAFLLVTTIKNN